MAWLRSAQVLLLALSLHSVWGCARIRDMDIFVDESDGEVEVCVTFTDTVSTSGTLTIAASLSGNAESPADFETSSRTFQIQGGTGRMPSDVCHTIIIHEDTILEVVEQFTVTVIGTNNVQVCSTGTQTVVRIRDSTRLPVSFTSATFESTNEQGVIDVCFNYSTVFTLERPFLDYQLPVIAEGATAGTVNREIMSLSMGISCNGVTITEDDVVEDDEFFMVTLTSSDTIDLVGSSTAKVVIRDDDMSSLRLVSTGEEVEEGDSGVTDVTFCMRLEDSRRTERDIRINASTETLTATPVVDFNELSNVVLTIPAGSRNPDEACGVVQIVGDLIREENRDTFNVVFTPQNPNDLIFTASFRVTINTDGDSECNE